MSTTIDTNKYITTILTFCDTSVERDLVSALLSTSIPTQQCPPSLMPLPYCSPAQILSQMRSKCSPMIRTDAILSLCDLPELCDVYGHPVAAALLMSTWIQWKKFPTTNQPGGEGLVAVKQLFAFLGVGQLNLYSTSSSMTARKTMQQRAMETEASKFIATIIKARTDGYEVSYPRPRAPPPPDVLADALPPMTLSKGSAQSKTAQRGQTVPVPVPVPAPARGRGRGPPPPPAPVPAPAPARAPAPAPAPARGTTGGYQLVSGAGLLPTEVDKLNTPHPGTLTIDYTQELYAWTHMATLRQYIMSGLPYTTAVLNQLVNLYPCPSIISLFSKREVLQSLHPAADAVKVTSLLACKNCLTNMGSKERNTRIPDRSAGLGAGAGGADRTQDLRIVEQYVRQMYNMIALELPSGMWKDTTCLLTEDSIEQMKEMQPMTILDYIAMVRRENPTPDEPPKTSPPTPLQLLGREKKSENSTKHMELFNTMVQLAILDYCHIQPDQRADYLQYIVDSLRPQTSRTGRAAPTIQYDENQEKRRVEIEQLLQRMCEPSF